MQDEDNEKSSSPKVRKDKITAMDDDAIVYTCPMHSEIRQQQAGNCPICGMSLELVTISIKEETSPEYNDMRRRFWFSLMWFFGVVYLFLSELPNQ